MKTRDPRNDGALPLRVPAVTKEVVDGFRHMGDELSRDPDFLRQMEARLKALSESDPSRFDH